jgi:hypothetical protein
MLWEKIKNLARYRALYGRELNRRSSNSTETELNEQLIGYPNNHNYQVHESKLTPCFRLYERYRTVESLYPKPLESFLDVACCKGFYVLSALLNHGERQGEPGCQKAVGMDVYAPFIALSNRVKEYLKARKASFYHTSLDEMAADPEAFGGPFQTVLLLGAYHYFFWGSDMCGSAYHSHEQILARLSRLCTGTLLLSGRLEFDRLPSRVQKRVKSSKHRQTYNTEDFVKSAETFFDIHVGGHLGRYPLFVMQKKKGI